MSTHTYSLRYPTITCRYCDGSSECRACHGTGEITFGLDNSAYGWDLPDEKVLRWNVVHEGEMDGTDHEILESLFRLFNIGDRPVPIRSMSVGDRVLLDGERLYVCAPIGFKRVVEEGMRY